MNEPNRDRGPLRWIAILLSCIGFYLYLFSSASISLGVFLLIQLLAGVLFTLTSASSSAEIKVAEHKVVQPYKKRVARSSSGGTQRKRRATKKSKEPAMAQHTRQAVRNAGRNPGKAPVRLIDIGLFAYFDNENEPRVFREDEIPDNTLAIQPFAIFHLDEKAFGPICFEILDDDMELRFREEEMHQFEVGTNYTYTQNYLSSLQDGLRQDRWCLQLHSGDHTIAIHYFDWFEVPDFKMGADGEINAEDLNEFIESQVREDLSLEQLMRTQ